MTTGGSAGTGGRILDAKLLATIGLLAKGGLLRKSSGWQGDSVWVGGTGWQLLRTEPLSAVTGGVAESGPNIEGFMKGLVVATWRLAGTGGRTFELNGCSAEMGEGLAWRVRCR